MHVIKQSTCLTIWLRAAFGAFEYEDISGVTVLLTFQMTWRRASLLTSGTGSSGQGSVNEERDPAKSTIGYR